MQDNDSNVKTILETGSALAESRLPPEAQGGHTPYVLLPPQYTVKDLESLLPAPTRKRGIVTMQDSPSFIEYLKKHGEEDHCVIYADVDYEAGKYSLTAVINDNGAGSAQWRDHRAMLSPILSLEWKRWTANNAKSMEQSVFAAFLEDNLGDIATVDGMPTGKDMLEMALAFEANSDKRFKKKLDLQGGGQHLEYIDQADEATTVKMRFFERFSIGIPVFQGSSEGFHIEARLKFRTTGGALAFWFELVRPDRVFKTAVSSDLEKIKAGAGFTVLIGQPGK